MLAKTNTELDKVGLREEILAFEALIREQNEVFLGDSEICPLKHTFSDGIYVREIFIPKGTYLTGKIHKHEHPNFLMSGTVDVVTEAGREQLTAPLSIISPPGTKRALYAVTDLVWITVHSNPTNTQDLEKLEKEVIADSYKAYTAFIENKHKPTLLARFINKLKRII